MNAESPENTKSTGSNEQIKIDNNLVIWALAVIVLGILSEIIIRNYFIWGFTYCFSTLLSESALLFSLPIIISSLFKLKTQKSVNEMYLAIGILFFSYLSMFTLIDTSPLFNSNGILTRQITDYLALLILPVSYYLVINVQPKLWKRYLNPLIVSAVSLGLLLFIGLFIMVIIFGGSHSRHRHRIERAQTAIYLPWVVFYSLIRVQEPKPIQEKGKILLKDQYIFISEPDEGVHILDNTDPKHISAYKFISIPGNTDIAIKGHYLYADCLTDLLVFDLSDMQNIKMINSIKNQFIYQNVGDKNGKYFGADPAKGVITGWEYD